MHKARTINRYLLTALLLLSPFFSSQAQWDLSQYHLHVPLRTKIARMLIVSAYGNGYQMSRDMRTCVEELQVGGIVIFEKWGRQVVNIRSREQLSSLVHDIRSRAGYPIFIGVDQEGGLVSRLKEKYGYPATVTPQHIGEVDSYWYTRAHAREMASTLRSSGFNMNFFPTLDINVNPQSPAIGKLQRSFSSNPQTVYRIAEVFFDIQKDSSIISVFKHFPGHGSAQADSHHHFTDVSDTWQKAELEIYHRFIQAGKCDAIMCSHIFNRHLDPKYPASLSHKILTEYMREESGFQGVFISDDIGMKALSAQWSIQEILRLSINAGIDMLMILRGDARYYDSIITQIEQMVLSGEIPLSRINESYNRILRLQEKVELQ